ncbi:tyrosine-type recombinase/integrase [Nostoc sp. FACHB-133]|nr:tyrosine-type recombinase/integrase [Nostoc sp. FACHB-133]
MKINRHGRAKVLTQQEIQLIFSHGLDNNRDKTLFGVCLFSACRIRECCTLQTQDIYTPKGNVRPRLVIRKANTKGKLATRSIPVIEDLRQLLISYYTEAGDIYLFPGRSDGHISEDSAAKILRTACKEVGIIGVSTHFTALSCCNGQTKILSWLFFISCNSSIIASGNNGVIFSRAIKPEAALSKTSVM